jgi:CubicO group peptidase (beta-lactamase class C family)
MHQSRRAFLRKIALTCVAAPAVVRAEEAPTPSEAAAMDGIVEGFMAQHSLPGFSVAVARYGELVHSKGYGYADSETGVTPASLFRIASVSKPITSVALFTLVEQGRLRLDDTIFGPGGILGTDYGMPQYPSQAGQIKLHHLMTHTCGGWPNDDQDPMFRNLEMSQQQLIAWTLANRLLTHAPGQQFAYSNFGYCLLGRVIEKVTGRLYYEYSWDAVLTRCGATQMRLGGNTRARNEVAYYGAGAYSMNLARMDSNGGWIATAADLVRFMTHVDGLAPERSILSKASIREMTTPTAANPYYAKGWSVNTVPNWWHRGSLPGASSILVRTASGFAWAALANSREGSGTETAEAMDQMLWKMVRQVKRWRV